MSAWHMLTHRPKGIIVAGEPYRPNPTDPRKLSTELRAVSRHGGTVAVDLKGNSDLPLFDAEQARK